MNQKNTSGPSVGDIARAAGVSRMAASFALRNLPGVSEATRARVKQIAEQLGYTPDARLASWMAQMRGTKSKQLLPIAWINTHVDRNNWSINKFLTPYFKGAEARAHELGYRLEEIWALEPGMTMRRLSQILYQRGIEGIIITHPARRFRLNWDHLAGVSLEGAFLAPRLHRVMTDNNYNLLLALKSLRRYRYRRIGIFLTEQADRFSLRILSATAEHFVSTLPKSDQIPPLFYPGEGYGDGPVSRMQLEAWIRRYQPEVIVCHSNSMIEWLHGLGLRVPEDIGLIHLAVDDDVLDWAGIHSNKWQMGATAAEFLISLMQNHQFGVPTFSLRILVSGSWHPGRTLQVPAPGPEPKKCLR